MAVLAQPTGTALADVSLIDHAQAPIRFAALFGGGKRLPGQAAQGAIGLAKKASTGEAALFPRLPVVVWRFPK